MICSSFDWRTVFNIPCPVCEDLVRGRGWGSLAEGSVGLIPACKHGVFQATRTRRKERAGTPSMQWVWLPWTSITAQPVSYQATLWAVWREGCGNSRREHEEVPQHVVVE